MKLNFSPALRMTIGVLSITLALLLVADATKIGPDGERNIIQQRQKYVEAIAIQLSLAAEKIDMSAFRELLIAASSVNSEVLSSAIRRQDGTLLAQYGEHEQQWDASISKNTATQMHLPVIRNQMPFASIEVKFNPIERIELFGLHFGTTVSLLIFIALAGGLAYWFVIRRSLLYLDPSAVVPDRVKSALDILMNGILILDENGLIVLANSSFAAQAGVPVEQLIGAKPSTLPWSMTNIKNPLYPWDETLSNGKSSSSVMVTLNDGQPNRRVFLVNSSPISSESDKQSGVMVCFNDVSEIQDKNKQLREVFVKLKRNATEIERQNQELHYMATRDPMTGCYNRRAFTQTFEEAYIRARNEKTNLCCIMTDIDHFKAVNDNYGHAAGDAVIKMVAGILQEMTPDGGMVGRYGGEEFCILLPGFNMDETRALADTCRQRIQATDCQNIRVTSSFGVASIVDGAANVDALICQADHALYASKRSGRNRVTRWSKLIEDVVNKTSQKQ